MEHLKIFELKDAWDKHPSFDKAVIKIETQLKKGNVKGGGNWVLDFLGDDYPQKLAFARRVIIKASSKMNTGENEV
jgi:hypothetical protein